MSRFPENLPGLLVNKIEKDYYYSCYENCLYSLLVQKYHILFPSVFSTLQKVYFQD